VHSIQNVILRIQTVHTVQCLLAVGQDCTYSAVLVCNEEKVGGSLQSIV